MSAALINRRAYLGAQNDAWFVIHGEAPALNNDNPRHDADRVAIAKVFDHDACTRMVACWNACKGIHTQFLEDLPDSLLAGTVPYHVMKAQHADLLAALQRCRFDSLNMSLADLEFCRATIARVTGSEPQPTLAIPPEAASIGAVLDGESLEQGEVL